MGKHNHDTNNEHLTGLTPGNTMYFKYSFTQFSEHRSSQAPLRHSINVAYTRTICLKIYFQGVDKNSEIDATGCSNKVQDSSGKRSALTIFQNLGAIFVYGLNVYSTN